MLELMKTLENPATECEACGGYLLCLGNEQSGWKLACMRCGDIAFEEVLPEHEVMLPPAGVDDGEVE
jgi:hypothetical protein